ncbi:MAG: hypothetical protein AAFQ94_06665 [Bacteroidota bacterium]
MIDTNLNYKSLQSELLDIASEYLNDTLDYGRLSETTAAYKSLLHQLYDEELDNETGRGDIAFTNGKAIGTFWAALCLDDLIRTRGFIKGIDLAIQEKLKDQKPLHILYAGTGPYATLLLPLMLKYAQNNFKYTFIEINPLSLQVLKQVISKIGFHDFDITYIQEDASTYQIDRDNQPDIIISETMQRALQKEQQVPIFLNLMDQAKADTVFIPEKIELLVGLTNDGFDFNNQQPEDFQKVGKLFEMSKASLLPKNRWIDEQNGEFVFQKTAVRIGEDQLENAHHLFLITEIQTYGEERIIVNESGLTVPTYLQSINENQSKDLFIESQYMISDEPRLNYRIWFSDQE